jgi:uncharacterized repeat protein (TIGR02543 family)
MFFRIFCILRYIFIFFVVFFVLNNINVYNANADKKSITKNDFSVDISFTVESFREENTYLDELILNIYASLIAEEVISLSDQYLRDIIEFSDGSQWVVAGISQDLPVGTGNINVRIFDSTEGLPDPSVGERTDYFMLIEGNPASYFVQKIETVPDIIFDETIGLADQTLPDIVEFLDDSKWIITGISNDYSTGRGSLPVRLFDSTEGLPDPSVGERSGHYMLIEGNPGTFFIRRVQGTPDLLIAENVNLLDQYLGEFIEFSDGGKWVITGVKENVQVGDGNFLVRVFDSTEGIPEPDIGERTDYYMLVESNPATFFVRNMILPNNSGMLHVSIAPDLAKQNGARWRRVGRSAWRESESVECCVPAGAHTLELAEADHFFDPENIDIVINENETTDEDVAYEGELFYVSFSEEGGTTILPPYKRRVSYSEPYGELPTSIRSGYTFSGWYTQITDGTKIDDQTLMTTGRDHTLYARWNANDYTVSFDPQGGEKPAPETKEVVFDAVYGDLATTSRGGYVFDGWYMNIAEGAEVTNATIVSMADNHTLYARWSGYLVIYHGNGHDEGDPPVDVEEYPQGEMVTVLGNADSMIKSGHAFLRWDTKADGSGDSYPSGSTLDMPNEDVALYAQWSPVPNQHVFPETGQSKCYDSSSEIDCPQPDAEYYGQDAQYPGPVRSYTKLGQGGEVLSEDARHVDEGGAWVITRDDVTGLMWEVKTLGNREHTYTWQETRDVFITTLNNQKFGGYDDWRLPTIMELSSLVHSGISDPGPTIDAMWFPLTQSTQYWAATTQNEQTHTAWLVDFKNGSIYFDGKTWNNFHARAVRSDHSAGRAPVVDHEDGTVTDPNTGLMWQLVAPSTQRTWSDALEYVQNLRLAKYDDWRLPNRSELQTLVDYTRHYPAIDPFLADDTMSGPYWSSTSFSGNAGYAWPVYFGYGTLVEKYKQDECNVRAVRMGLSEAHGLLTAKITPPEAIAAGAKWRRSGATIWRDNEQTSLAPVGRHGVEFATIEGWSKPDNLSVTVVADETASVSGAYEQTHFKVDLEVSPADAGSTIGEGLYPYYTRVIITATAQGNYVFERWTEEGKEISTDSAFSFHLAEEKNLTAEFRELANDERRVSVSAAPHDAGLVSGGGAFKKDEIVLVRAEPFQDAVFSHWAEKGEDKAISHDAAYEFSMGEEHRDLVAHFDVPQPIPTLSQWGMLFLMILMLMVAAWKINWPS